MFELKRKSNGKIVSMDKMLPYDIGEIIISPHPDLIGEIVMRTASTSHHEVISLSVPGWDHCWGRIAVANKVRLFDRGEEITLRIL